MDFFTEMTQICYDCKTSKQMCDWVLQKVYRHFHEIHHSHFAFVINLEGEGPNNNPLVGYKYTSLQNYNESFCTCYGVTRFVTVLCVDNELGVGVAFDQEVWSFYISEDNGVLKTRIGSYTDESFTEPPSSPHDFNIFFEEIIKQLKEPEES